MKQGTKRLLALLLCGCLGLGVSVLAARAGLATPESAAQVRADILIIDTLAAYGPLDQSPVAFLHDKHTQTLAKHKDFYQKACQTCHQVKDGRMVLAFQRPEDARGQTALKDTYHSGCIGCHASMAKAGLAAGPQDVDCKGCHAAPTAVSGWQALSVDKRLHFRHARTQASAENKCGACHHVYDDASRRTVPAGKPEDVPGDCGYCHEAADRVIPGGNPERVRNLRLAAHGQCVACHLKIAGDDPKAATGPSSCAGCHGALDQKSVAEASQKKVPAEADLRIPRGQPDLALIRPEKPLTALIPGETAKPADMPPVAFDHKAHEGKSESCATCHHAQLSSCAGSCHTLLGAKDGGFVNLAAAMHAPADPASCAGCHAREQAKPACAGCHAVRGRNVFSAGTAGCAACHQAPTPAVQAAVEGLDGVAEPKATAAREAELAKALIEARPTVAGVKIEDIPETVTIKALAKDYQASVLPHRAIVLALEKGLAESKLAKAFHTEQATVCQGCHHHSPATLTPPRCSNCHGATSGPDSAAPALKAAYHGQCMGCHTRMGIEGKVAAAGRPQAKPVPLATACDGCHKPALAKI